VIDVRVAVGQIAALLLTIPDAQMHGYPNGEIPQGDPPPTPTGDDRVKAYWILYAGSGVSADERLDATAFVSSLTFQVTVAGGTPDRALFGIGKVRSTINGVEIGSGLITEQPFDPGTLRRDDAVVPPRHYVPLQFRLEP
jgi:hypothetical protein